MGEKIELAILGATFMEVSPLLPLLAGSEELAARGERAWKGTYAGRTVVVGTLGFNKVNAAITTAMLLERFSVSRVWHVGCAGAYEGGPLRVGDVLMSDRAICGDEGVLGRDGVSSAREIGIPILRHGGSAFYDDIPLDHQPEMRRIREKFPAGAYGCSPENPPLPAISCRSSEASDEREVFQLLYGPSLTVGMASGDPSVAGNRYARYGAFAENMEGSAVAQACFRFDVPVVECRGMSNTAGDRQKAHWRIDEAVSHCCSIVATMMDAFLKSFSPPPLAPRF